MGQKLRKYANIIAVVMQIIALAAVVVSFIMIDTESCYRLLWLWPLTYFVYSFFVFGPLAVIREDHLIGVFVISVFEFFPRYVLYPLAVSIAGPGYRGIEYAALTNSEIMMALFMGVVELIAVGAFLYFLERIKKKKEEIYNGSLELAGSSVVYGLFIIVAFAAYLFVGRQNNVIQFLASAEADNEARGGLLLTLVKYVVSIGLLILTLLLIAALKKRYDVNHSRIYAYGGIIVAMFHTSFLVGTSRSTQIAVGVLMMLILLRCFPSMKLEIIVSISAITILAFSTITFMRTGNNSFFKTGTTAEMADKLQIYFGGPQSLAQSVKAVKSVGKDNIGQMLFDFVRSCFPLNLIFKGYGYTTSQWYNLTIYDGRSPNGQLLFSSSFGYIFLGVFGIALDTCLNVFLLLLSCEYYNRAKSFEGKYLAGFCLIRFTFTVMENTPSVLGSVTQYIWTLGLLIVVSRALNRQKQKKSMNYFPENRSDFKRRGYI